MIVAVACRFKRTKDGKFETGVAITNQTGTQSVLGIMDKNGKAVDGPWDFALTYIYGCMILPSDTLFERGGT
jgi:hypothetical protein